FMGNGFANSFLGGDESKGTLTSPEFAIERPFVNFLIGGGGRPGEACINLLIDGRIARSATGKDNELLEWSSWDVKEFAGKHAQIQIVDNATGPWGHLNVDQIYESEQSAGTTASQTKLPEG